MRLRAACNHQVAHVRLPQFQYCYRRPTDFRRFMIGRAAPTTIEPPNVQRSPGYLRLHLGRLFVPAASDRLAPARCDAGLAARQHPQPSAEISGGEVSSHFLSKILVRLSEFMEYPVAVRLL